MDISKFDSKIKKSGGGIIPNKLVEKLLNKFGPEGVYELSEKLIKAAEKDVFDALAELNKTEDICEIYLNAVSNCDKVGFNGENVCNDCNYRIK